MPTGRGNPRFCLELLQTENKPAVTAALLKCVSKVKSEVERSGRKFHLREHYSSVGRCIAEHMNIVSPDGTVNKGVLQQRVQSTPGISDEDRAFYLELVPTCETWDSCLTKHCKL